MTQRRLTFGELLLFWWQPVLDPLNVFGECNSLVRAPTKILPEVNLKPCSLGVGKGMGMFATQDLDKGAFHGPDVACLSVGTCATGGIGGWHACTGTLKAF